MTSTHGKHLEPVEPRLLGREAALSFFTIYHEADAVQWLLAHDEDPHQSQSLIQQSPGPSSP